MLIALGVIIIITIKSKSRNGEATIGAAGFVALFNGKDLTGWMTHPTQPGNWRVEDGVIIGSGPLASHLYTERGDYKDFHLRAEARINGGGDGGVCFRTSFGPFLPAERPMWPLGYEAQINCTGSDRNKNGSLFASGKTVFSVLDSNSYPDFWFTLEVIAEGNHILTKVNGKVVADFTDTDRQITSGRIALQQHDPETKVEFRTIEIKELNGSSRSPTAGPAVPKLITNRIGMKLALIPAGEFLMGAPDSDTDAEDHEHPRHRVKITQPFYLGVYEVTQGQYRTVTGANPSSFKRSNDLPVENVSWYDAIAFCNTLSAREGLKPYYHEFGAGSPPGGDGYRLPTEAEWEYACRAGTTTRFSFGDWSMSLGEYAWYAGNSDSKSHPVGQKRPNAFGLYDMHGNVGEWCWDVYEKTYYANSPGADPPGPSPAAVRVDRGGSWLNTPQFCRSTSRDRMTPVDRNSYWGFRVARSQSGR
jgi:formylglycine-generating enzyme required for sulfatase activity